MKAIITDLDNTLLHTDKSMSQYTVNTLRQCHDNGILVMAASARPFRSVRAYSEQLSFDAVTTLNGAAVILPQNELIFSISAESSEKIILGLMSFQDVFISIETNIGLFSNREFLPWKPIVYTGFPKLPDKASIYKILASSKCKQLYQSVESILTSDVYYTVAENELVQIMSIDATKWNGVLHMLSHFWISPSDAVYFGDDNDDIEAIRNCGLGVAVSNAIPEALDAADEITDSNDEDGVARFIEKYVLR